MSVLPNDLNKKISEIERRFPKADKVLVKEIMLSALGERVNGYVSACEVEKSLGLNKGYFSRALHRRGEIRAMIIKEDTDLLVKLHDDIRLLLVQGYTCNKIEREESEDYDRTIFLTSQTLLGFYK